MAVAEPIPPEQRPETYPPTSTPDMDEALTTLSRAKERWAQRAIPERLRLLEDLRDSFADVADRWVAACRIAEGTARDATSGEEWLAGPYLILRNLRLLERSLKDLRTYGRPRIPGRVQLLPNGRTAAQVFPADWTDKAFFPGVTAEVWMEPGVTPETLEETQAPAYHQPVEGRVALVLGAGNVSSIGPMDALYKLFVEHQVVLYKSHPVNDYLGPLMAEAFEPLARRGYFRLVYGGAEEGAYLCNHDLVDEIHITGSDRTYEAIVFGPGEEGRKRKAARRPLLDKPVSAELGNVSPVIVVPGPWSASDVEYQAENLVSMLTNNAGFNCNAARVVIQHEQWGLRNDLVDEMRRILRSTPTRKAYYPGAEERFADFSQSRPESFERYGAPGDDELPWGFAADLDPSVEDDPFFRREAFCSLFGETALSAATGADFVRAAVDFANERLWGTLNATLLVHPDTMKDPQMREAVDAAVTHLRYGTVAINCWAAVGYGLGVTTWGAYPGHTPWDIQSGVGVVHNTLMFSKAEKSVVRSPFRAFPKPPWFVSHGTGSDLARQLTRFENDRSLFRLPAVTWFALRG